MDEINDPCLVCGAKPGKCFHDQSGVKARMKKLEWDQLHLYEDFLELKEKIMVLGKCIPPDKPKYLPCPFCGHKDINLITTSLQNYQKFECFCHSCGIPGPGSRDKYRAIASWNRRV